MVVLTNKFIVLLSGSLGFDYVMISGIAKGGLGGHVLTQISLGQQRLLTNDITNKKQVMHTLAASRFHCKSTELIYIKTNYIM